MEKINKERFFTVELKSKVDLKNITLNNGNHDVLVEGNLGMLQQAIFAEDVILEIVGNKGVLRINLSQGEIKTKQQEMEVQ